MRKSGWVGVLAVWGLALPLPVRSTPLEPTERALKTVEALHARSMGVDRAGNLWSWDPQIHTVDIWAPSGAKVSSYKVPDAQAVDADAEWGIAVLLRGGREIRWLHAAQGSEDLTLPLDGPASQVCWVGSATVAVAPQAAAYRVGIWNLKDRLMARTLGQEMPLHPTYGATRMRAVVLRYDFGRDLLFTLESYLGDLQVFTLDGKLSWRASVDHPLRAEHERWLLDVDRQAKERRDVQTPVVYWFYLGLDASGAPWVVRNLDAAAKTVSMVKLSVNGNSERQLAAPACASRTFTFWGGRLIFFTDPASPQGACVGERSVS